MNINFYNNNFTNTAQANPAFGKKFLDTDIKIRNTDGTKSKAYFVEYERDNFRDAMKIENLEKEWKDRAPFISSIASHFNTFENRYWADGIHLYGLEDEFENTLALAKVINNYSFSDNDNSVYISYIQTSPDEMYTSRTKRYKGIGETLVAEIVQKAKNDGADTIELTSVNENFWESSKLFHTKRTESKRKSEKFLPKDDFDSYISFVESKIKPSFSAWG